MIHPDELSETILRAIMAASLEDGLLAALAGDAEEIEWAMSEDLDMHCEALGIDADRVRARLRERLPAPRPHVERGAVARAVAACAAGASVREAARETGLGHATVARHARRAAEQLPLLEMCA